jgi:hypothetical protein
MTNIEKNVTEPIAGGKQAATLHRFAIKLTNAHARVTHAKQKCAMIIMYL